MRVRAGTRWGLLADLFLLTEYRGIDLKHWLDRARRGPGKRNITLTSEQSIQQTRPACPSPIPDPIIQTSKRGEVRVRAAR